MQKVRQNSSTENHQKNKKREKIEDKNNKTIRAVLYNH